MSLLFYLHDLYTGTKTQFGSARDLASHWHRMFGHGFSELNVTGTDMNCGRVLSGWSCADGRDPVPIFEPEYHTRRYQVLDGLGRSVDIRDWPCEWFAPVPCRPRDWGLGGHRLCRRRRSGPSMRVRVLRADAADELDGVREDWTVNARQIGIRNKAMLKGWDWNDYYDRATKGLDSRSWKDQTRARRQYAKHKRGVARPMDKHVIRPAVPA